MQKKYLTAHRENNSLEQEDLGHSDSDDRAAWTGPNLPACSHLHSSPGPQSVSISNTSEQKYKLSRTLVCFLSAFALVFKKG